MVLYDRIKAHSMGRALAGCLLLALTLPCAAQAKDVERAGFVVDVKGTWVTVLGDAAWSVHRNSYVYAGQRIQAKQPLANSSITIALANGTAIRRSCVQDVASCGLPIVIDDAPPVPSIGARIGTAVMNLIRPDDAHSAVTVARDVFGPRPGVIGLKDGQLDLRPALTRIPEGTYLAVLAPGDQGAPDTGPEAPPRYPAIVPPAGPIWIKTGALQPGLYQLTILSAGGKEPVGSAVRVLVASDKDFDAQHRDFAEAQEVLSKWDEGIPASSVDYVLTVYLKAIASGATGKR